MMKCLQYCMIPQTYHENFEILCKFPGTFWNFHGMSRKCHAFMNISWKFMNISWKFMKYSSFGGRNPPKGQSGVAPANQTKERSLHELFTGAFRNKNSMWVVLVFPRKKNQNSHKNGRNSWTSCFGIFSLVWFAGATPETNGSIFTQPQGGGPKLAMKDPSSRDTGGALNHYPPSKKLLTQKHFWGIIFGVIATVSRNQLRKKVIWELFSRELRKFRVTQHGRVWGLCGRQLRKIILGELISWYFVIFSRGGGGVHLKPGHLKIAFCGARCCLDGAFSV